MVIISSGYLDSILSTTTTMGHFFLPSDSNSYFRLRQMGIFLYKENKGAKRGQGSSGDNKKICGGGVVIAVFEYKAGFKWWRGNAWSSPEKKKKARKEGRHIHTRGAERRERNEKIKPIVWCEDATTCNAASQC